METYISSSCGWFFIPRRLLNTDTILKPVQWHENEFSVQSKTVIISQETTFKSTLMYFRNKS